MTKVRARTPTTNDSTMPRQQNIFTFQVFKPKEARALGDLASSRLKILISKSLIGVSLKSLNQIKQYL